MAEVDALQSHLKVAFSEDASALTPSSSNFSLKCTSESESIVVAIIVHVQHLFNTAAISVTTDLSAPLSRPKFHLSSPREEVSEVLSV